MSDLSRYGVYELWEEDGSEDGELEPEPDDWEEEELECS